MILVSLGIAGPLVLSFTAAPASAVCVGACSPVGFTTHDGYFYVQAGGTIFGDFSPVSNGSQVYAFSLTVEISSLVGINETAIAHLYESGSSKSVANQSLIVAPYANDYINLTIPSTHQWTELELKVDGTPVFFSVETPYYFLSIPGIEDGGLDFSIFIALGIFWVFFVFAYLKGKHMTDRAVKGPGIEARTWFHGTFAAMFVLYLLDFQLMNSVFQGWEFLVIPIPEACFFLFWSGTQHDKSSYAMIVQGVPVTGAPIRFNLDFWDHGTPGSGPAAGKLVACGEGIWQWWYRSRGYHTILYEDKKDGAPEPMAFDVTEGSRLTPEQVAWLGRIPQNPASNTSKGFLTRMMGHDKRRPVTHMFCVASRDDWDIKLPYWSWWRAIPAHEDTDPGGFIVKIPERHKFRPHIEPGYAHITLAPWHYQFVWALNFGWIRPEDLEKENQDLLKAIWALKGTIDSLTGKKSETAMNALVDLQNRPKSDLSPEDLEAGVARRRQERGLEGPEESAEAVG